MGVYMFIYVKLHMCGSVGVHKCVNNGVWWLEASFSYYPVNATHLAFFF